MEVDMLPMFINPLHVLQQSSGKYRLGSVEFKHVRLEKVCLKWRYRTVFDLSQSGYFFSTFDLEFRHHHVGILPDDRHLILLSNILFSGFRLFGLSSAPYIFTKLVRALVGYWRGLGRRVVALMMVSLAHSISSLAKTFVAFVVPIWSWWFLQL